MTSQRALSLTASIVGSRGFPRQRAFFGGPVPTGPVGSYKPKELAAMAARASKRNSSDKEETKPAKLE